MAHSHNHHREHQVAHRRVHKILEEHGHGAKHHHTGPHSHAFSKVTSKTAAMEHKAEGKKAPKRYARGGKVKKDDGGGVSTSPMFPYQGKYKGLADQMRTQADDAKEDVKNAMDAKSRENSRMGRAKGGRVKGHKGNTNIAIVIPHHAPGSPSAVAPTGGAGAGGPPGVMAGGPPPMPPPGGGPGMPPGMPMRARGGGVHIDGGATKENLSKWAARASANSFMRGGAATGVGRLEQFESMKRKGK